MTNQTMKKKNQIDMFVDFDNGILSYANIAYTVHIGFFWFQTEVQIAKIKVLSYDLTKTQEFLEFFVFLKNSEKLKKFLSF